MLAQTGAEAHKEIAPCERLNVSNHPMMQQIGIEKLISLPYSHIPCGQIFS
jgi:hypothetical protein